MLFLQVLLTVLVAGMTEEKPNENTPPERIGDELLIAMIMDNYIYYYHMSKNKIDNAELLPLNNKGLRDLRTPLDYL